MKINILFVFLFLLATNYSYSQDNLKKNELLWCISGNGLDEPSYLLGTNHAMHYYYLDSIPGCWEAFNSVDQLVSEVLLQDTTINQIDFNAVINHIVPEANNKHRNKTRNINYKEYLSQSDFEYLQSTYNSFSGTDSLSSTNLVPVDLFLWFRSVFHKKENLNSRTFFLKNHKDFRNQVWMDAYLQDEAAQRNYSILGLETVKGLEILRVDEKAEIERIKREQNTDTSTYTLTNNLVKYLKIKERENFESHASKFNSLYMSQSLKLIEQIASDITEDTLALYNATSSKILRDLDNKYLLEIRNKNWIKTLPDILHNRPSFVAVGCAHLPGEYGLINLLRKEGYSVELVKEIPQTSPSPARIGLADIRREKIEHEFNELKQNHYDEEWFAKFKLLVLFAKSWFKDKYDQDLNTLKMRIPDKDQNEFEDFFKYSFSPRFYKGDSITDLQLYDVEGNKKQLLNIKPSGKYLILCFWQSSELSMSQVIRILPSTECYKEKVEIIYINTDHKPDKWLESGKDLNKKYNFRVDMNDNEILTKYLNMESNTEEYIPNYYYLVSPDNKILNIQNVFYSDEAIKTYIIP